MAAWLGVHAMLLSGTHSKADAFLTWAWDFFDRDHAATVEASSMPKRIAWGDDDQDIPHISLDRPEAADAPPRGMRRTRRTAVPDPRAPANGPLAVPGPGEPALRSASPGPPGGALVIRFGW